MRILHYSLGFPPYRTGGLTKFCIDLMQQQLKDGNEVSLLWPGKMQFLNSRTNIREHNSVNGVGNYEVINPLPMPYDEGIKDFECFRRPGDKTTYEQFLNLKKPDVIHIHTLMGLHKSFLEVARDKGIWLVFTAHDFFPICPKVTLFRNGKICNTIDSCKECGVCNNTALSVRKIQLLQSPVYRKFKDSALVKSLRKRHREAYLSDEVKTNNQAVGSVEDYRELRDYYYSLLKMMDMIHYNSSITKRIYEQLFDLPDNVIVSITHADIADHRVRRTFKDNLLRIRYLGPEADYKGYYILRRATDQLWEERKSFVLDVHFFVDNKPDYMNCHDRFSYSDLEDIFNNTDVLVCPSIWYETFGFTVLEALSYGIPVIISNFVGAKDVLADGAGIVIEDIDSEKIYNVLKGLDTDILGHMNLRNVKEQRIIVMERMTQEFYDKVYCCNV